MPVRYKVYPISTFIWNLRTILTLSIEEAGSSPIGVASVAWIANSNDAIQKEWWYDGHRALPLCNPPNPTTGAGGDQAAASLLRSTPVTRADVYGLIEESCWQSCFYRNRV